MEEHYDVIVVGVGSMGASACYHLAKRGAKVLGLDSQSVPNTNSSYNGNTRVIRLTYQEHPDYVPLLKDVGFRCAKDRLPFMERVFGAKSTDSKKSLI